MTEYTDPDFLYVCKAKFKPRKLSHTFNKSQIITNKQAQSRYKHSQPFAHV